MRIAVQTENTGRAKGGVGGGAAVLIDRSVSSRHLRRSTFLCVCVLDAPDSLGNVTHLYA